jgi:ATP phosphoribosyltransferase regulatory subunit
MRDNKLHTPNGFKDCLPDALMFKQSVARRIEEVFMMSGYLPIESPMLEYMDVFEGKGSTSPKNMYRFIGRDGEALTLRSDMTPPIARIAATCYSIGDAPLRFCYTAKAFRCQESYKGKAGEFTESGVELLGAGSAEADAEVVALAVESLLAAGLSEFRLDLGEVGFLAGILEETGLCEEDKCVIRSHLANRNFAAIERFLGNRNLPGRCKEVLTGLHSLIGGRAVLEAAKAMTGNRRAIEAIESLEALSALLDDCGISDCILFDLGMTGHLNYYTGILFQGYARGIGFSILDGGRYDKLVGMFGMPFPAVGFAVKIENLASAISSDVSASARQPLTLLAFSDSGRKSALQAARELKRQGVPLVNSLAEDHGMQPHLEHARKKGIKGVLYFDEGKVTVWDIEEGKGKTVDLSDLWNEVLGS